MASIDIQNLLTSLGGLDAASALTAPLQRDRVYWLGRDEEASARRRALTQHNPLLQTLDRVLGNFEKSLAAFSWPKQALPWQDARLVIKNPSMEGALDAELRYGQEATPFEKLTSKGFDPNAKSELSPGTYPLTLTLGKSAVTVPVILGSEDETWGQVLSKVKNAVNFSTSQVQAEVITQQRAYEKNPSVAATGSSLLLTVDPANRDQLLLLDTRQTLARSLDFAVTVPPATAPALGRYDLSGLRQALPSAFLSSPVDPNALTGLNPGTYYISYAIGQTNGIVGVSVGAGDSWEDVLSRAAGLLNNAGDKVMAEVVRTKRAAPINQTTRVLAEAIQLKVTAQNAKLGERLRLTDAASPNAVTAFYDPASGLPQPQTVGTAYIASATANGWTKNRIYTFEPTAAVWVETTPAAGATVAVQSLSHNEIYNGSAWTPAASIIEASGLNATATPGSDAGLKVDGRDMFSASGTFSLDQGRLAVKERDAFGGPAQLTVIEALDHIRSKVLDIVSAYNDLRSFLSLDAAMWKSGAAEVWRAPLNGNRADLGWLGLQETGAKKVLWANQDRFWNALREDPAKAQQALASTDKGRALGLVALKYGLVPAWTDLAASIREQGLVNLLAPTSAFVDLNTPWRLDYENEKDMRLLDLMS